MWKITRAFYNIIKEKENLLSVNYNIFMFVRKSYKKNFRFFPIYRNFNFMTLGNCNNLKIWSQAQLIYLFSTLPFRENILMYSQLGYLAKKLRKDNIGLYYIIKNKRLNKDIFIYYHDSYCAHFQQNFLLRRKCEYRHCSSLDSSI